MLNRKGFRGFTLKWKLAFVLSGCGGERHSTPSSIILSCRCKKLFLTDEVYKSTNDECDSPTHELNNSMKPMLVCHRRR